MTVPSVIWEVPTEPAANVGLGYVPAKLPPAVPFGVKPDGVPVTFDHATSLILAFVIPKSATLAVVTVPSVICVVPTEPAANVGLG